MSWQTNWFPFCRVIWIFIQSIVVRVFWVFQVAVITLTIQAAFVNIGFLNMVVLTNVYQYATSNTSVLWPWCCVSSSCNNYITLQCILHNIAQHLKQHLKRAFFWTWIFQQCLISMPHPILYSVVALMLCFK